MEAIKRGPCSSYDNFFSNLPGKKKPPSGGEYSAEEEIFSGFPFFYEEGGFVLFPEAEVLLRADFAIEGDVPFGMGEEFGPVAPKAMVQGDHDLAPDF